MGDGKPTVGAIRRQLGLPVPPTDPSSDVAIDCERHAWTLYRYVVAHLVYAQRVQSPETAPFVAQEVLHQWAEYPHDFNALADELILEAADYRPR